MNMHVRIPACLHDVENDTKSRAFCGPTAVAAITGEPISVVRNAFRLARFGANWVDRDRAPAITGTSFREVERVFRLFGFVGRWQNVRDNPTLAAWLEQRDAEIKCWPCVVNVTGHYVAVAGWTFCDTFTKGRVIDADEAPRRRSRVKQFFIVTGRCPTANIPAKVPYSKSPEAKETARKRSSFARLARAAGASYEFVRDGLAPGIDELRLGFSDRRTLYIHQYRGEWEVSEQKLQRFLNSLEPDPQWFECDEEGVFIANDF